MTLRVVFVFQNKGMSQRNASLFHTVALTKKGSETSEYHLNRTFSFSTRKVNPITH